MKYLHYSIILLVFALFSCASKTDDSISNPPFFVVLGDTWYHQDQMDEYFNLIDTINVIKPSFAVHVGDIRGSDATPCTNEQYFKVRSSFNEFEVPLIYTPGDNEWTDCWMENRIDSLAGGYIPSERLSTLRQVFFQSNESHGKKKILLERQSDVDTFFIDFVENVRWWDSDFLFFTLHIVGSNNGWFQESSHPDSEFQRRNQANIAWLNNCFDLAISRNAKAVVMFYHAEIDPTISATLRKAKNAPESLDAQKVRLHEIERIDGYAELREKIKDRSIGFSAPVLQVYGDEHQFKWYQPYKFWIYDSLGRRNKADNVYRLQTFGSPNHRAVKVTLNPEKPYFFDIEPIYLK